MAPGPILTAGATRPEKFDFLSAALDIQFPPLIRGEGLRFAVSIRPVAYDGGADGIRTHDLQSAILALSRLSYCPTKAHAASMTIPSDDETVFNTVGSPMTRPIGLTGLAGRISSPSLTGVFPKKIHKALPGGQ